MIVWALSMGGASIMSRIVGRVIEGYSFSTAIAIGAVPLAVIVFILLLFWKTKGFKTKLEK